jgi:hypothetical protein
MAHAEDAIGESIDCTDVRVHYVDDPTLTHQERLRLMDKAFLESLDKFELCRAAQEMAAASNGTAGNGATADSGALSNEASKDSPENANGEADSTSAGASAASPTMSGTESDSLAEGIETAAQGGLQGYQNPKEAGGNTGGRLKQANGKLPDDIPSVQNDDALAAQIRYAAENETDPVKREQLWNEYRKYKGLPTQ